MPQVKQSGASADEPSTTSSNSVEEPIAEGACFSAPTGADAVGADAAPTGADTGADAAMPARSTLAASAAASAWICAARSLAVKMPSYARVS